MSFSPKWGDFGAPLIPSSAKSLFQGKPIPRWLSVSLNLPGNSDAGTLCSPIRPQSTDELPNKALQFAQRLINANKHWLRDVPAIGLDCPSGLSLDEIDMSVRTKNCILSSREIVGFQNVTFGQLFRTPNMGIKSVLEFACNVESAIISTGYEKQRLEDASKIKEVIGRVDSYSSKPWAEQIGSEDPRFSRLWFMNDQVCSLAELIESVIQNHDIQSLYALEKKLPEIERCVNEIDSQNLETSLGSFFLKISETSGLRYEALLARFGWGGDPPVTLEGAGEILGVTRERIRQLQKKITVKLQKISPYLPALDKAIEALESAAPLAVSEAIQLLKDQGISDISFHPKSVIAAAKDFHKETSLRVRRVKGKQIVFSKLDGQGVKKLLSLAKNLSGKSGATNIFEVLDKLDEIGEKINEESAKKLLRQLDQIRFLTGDWFWMPEIPPHRNRLRNIARKMISVATPISVADIREGLKREYFFRNSSNQWNLRVPPMDALIEFFIQNKEFKCDENNLVRYTEHLDYKRELGRGPQALVEILRSSPSGVLDRDSIRDGCIARNTNLYSMEISLSYNAIIERLGSSLYKLRGISASASEIEAVRKSVSSRPVKKRIKDHGWSDDGNVYIVARLPKYLHTFVFGAPSAVKRFVAGQRFDGLMESGKSFGKITVTEEGAIVGTPPYLRRAGADEGDLLRIEFDLTEETATLKIIPEY